MNTNKFSVKIYFHSGYVAKDIRRTSAPETRTLRRVLQEWKAADGAYVIEVLDRTTGQETIYEKNENGNQLWSKTVDAAVLA